MGSDWDFINEHMGGHDADGLPNFVHGFDDFRDEEYDDRYVVYNPDRPVESRPVWIGEFAPLGKLLGLSVKEALVIEALRKLAWSLKTSCDSADYQYKDELTWYEIDKAEFEAGNSDLRAEDLVEKKVLVDEEELAFEVAADEFTVIKNAYSRASWLAHQPIEQRAVLTSEARRPPETLFELVETQVQGSTYPLFAATTQLSIDLTRELVLEAVKNDDSAFGYSSGIFKFDREPLLEAVKNDGPALDDTFDTFETFKADQELLLDAVKEYGWALDDASDTFKDDRELVLEAIKNHGFDLCNASDALKDDRELVLEAIKNHGFDLCNASDALKGDREIVLEAIRHDGFSLKHASNTLKADRDLVLEAVRHDRFSHKHQAHYLKGLGNDDSPLQYASDTLRSDREIVIEAVTHDCFSLKHASDALKDDRETVLAAVRYYGYSLEYASDTLKADQELQSIKDIWGKQSF
jgi:hypothetical protein